MDDNGKFNDKNRFYATNFLFHNSAHLMNWIVPFLQVTLGIYACLFLLEDMTGTMVICGIISQILHLSLLSSFPFFALLSPQFIAAIGKFKYMLVKCKFDVLNWNINYIHNFEFVSFSYVCCQSLFGISIFCWKLPSIFWGKITIFNDMLD